MSTKWKNTKQTENTGLLVVANIVNNSSCILNKIDGSNDIGLDGYLEFVEKESATGFCIGIQVKSGNSYQTSNGKFALLKSDKAHFEYWKSHSLPVVGIIYVPDDKKAYWVDISDYLASNPRVVEAGPYDIKVSKEQVFSEETFSGFYKNVLDGKEIFKSEVNFAKVLKGMAGFRPAYERIDSIKSLFYFYRDSKEAWYYIVQQFVSERDEDIQKLLIYLMSHIIGHGDIFWHKNNILNEGVRAYAKTVIVELYGISEVKKLINNIGEGGISRGEIGQGIYPIIKLVSKGVEIFKEFILDKNSTEHIRFWSGVLVIDELQKYDLERAINFANSMVINFPNSEYKEIFKEVKFSLEEFEYVDFHG